MTKVGAVRRVHAVYQPTIKAYLRERVAEGDEVYFENDYELAGYVNWQGFEKTSGSLREPGAVDWLPGRVPLGHFRVRVEFK